jgi:formylglycine-generating enzyme required for sulfatase activity
MAFDAFISYSHTDKAVADAACAALEGAGIRCWIAPRDVPPGSQWAAAIIRGIDHCRVMVLIFSSQSNISNQIHREVERAVSKGIPIIPLRIENINPTSSMEYFLGSIHWLDALTPPLEKHLQRLAETVKSSLDFNQSGLDAPTRSGNTQQAAIGPNAISAIQTPPEGVQHDGSSHQARAQLHQRPARRWVVLAALCVLIAACGGAASFYLKYRQGATVTQAADILTPPVEERAAAVPVDQQTIVSPAASSDPCRAGAVTASLASRCATPLSAAEERALKPKDSFKECDKCPEMVVVPAGSFTMGSPPYEVGRYDREGPLHEVTFKKSFAAAKFTVTADQFAAFGAETGHDSVPGCYTLEGGRIVIGPGLSWRNPGFAPSGSQPAVCVAWNDAKAYVAWLSGKTGKAYRLLTEAEWEYAARAGTRTRYFFGDLEKDLCGYGNGADLTAKNNLVGIETWAVAPCSDSYVFPAPVGTFSPNGYGLYDMLGNAAQWTEDCNHDSYLGAPSDGSAWATGDCSRRVVRGNAWASVPRDLRSAARFGVPSNDRGNGISFRVGRTLAP